jgi:transcriptional regulator with XRE-family HTH domain
MDAEALKRMRALLGFSQGDFARRLGISQPALSQFEREIRPVPHARRRQIERMLQAGVGEREERD